MNIALAFSVTVVALVVIALIGRGLIYGVSEHLEGDDP